MIMNVNVRRSTVERADIQTYNVHCTPEDDEVIYCRRAKNTPTKKAITRPSQRRPPRPTTKRVQAQRHIGFATRLYRHVEFGSLIDGPFSWLVRRSYLLTGVQQG
jgi:hypothetical protein